MKQKSFADYDTKAVRKVALRVYVNEGERQVIDDAIAESERLPDHSTWVSKVLLREACRILRIQCPLLRTALI
jgi:hypothetical protein